MKELMLLLAAFGLAYIVGHSKVSLPFRIALTPPDHRRGLAFWCMRTFVDLIECVACFGFWEGFVSTWLGWWVPFGGGWLGAVTAGCLVAGTNLILGSLTKLI